MDWTIFAELNKRDNKKTNSVLSINVILKRQTIINDFTMFFKKLSLI